jgi:hypothetical protein
MKAGPAGWTSRMLWQRTMWRGPAVEVGFFRRIKGHAYDAKNPSRRWRSPFGSAACRASCDRPGFEKLTGPSNDPIYFADCHFIEIGYLRLRHPVVRQGAHSTELGGRYLAGLALDGRPSPYHRRFRGRFDLRCSHRSHRWDCEDTWLPSRLVLSRRSIIRGRCWCVSTCDPLRWLEQIFRILARSVDPFTIVVSARRLPVCWQEIPQKNR